MRGPVRLKNVDSCRMWTTPWLADVAFCSVKSTTSYKHGTTPKSASLWEQLSPTPSCEFMTSCACNSAVCLVCGIRQRVGVEKGKISCLIRIAPVNSNHKAASHAKTEYARVTMCSRSHQQGAVYPQMSFFLRTFHSAVT